MQIGVDSQRAVENRRVFVIDSDEVIGTALQFMLADEYETHVFADVTAAVEKGRDWPPDLILLGMAVVGAIAGIRAAQPGARILLVCDGTAAEQAQAQGAEGVLTLPLKLETVRRTVDAQLGRPAGFAIPVVPV